MPDCAAPVDAHPIDITLANDAHRHTILVISGNHCLIPLHPRPDFNTAARRPVFIPIDPNTAVASDPDFGIATPQMEQNHMLPPPLDARERSLSDSIISLPPHPPPSYAQTPEPAAASSLSPSLSSSATGPSPKYPFPDVSGNALPPIQHLAHHESYLPSLSSVTGPNLYRDSPSSSDHPKSTVSSPTPTANHWPSMNPLTQFYTPSHLQQSSPSESSSGRMEVDSPRESRRGNSVSLDDPDVRMAAEALGDLRADFVSSPPKKYTALPSTPVARGRVSGTVTPHLGPSEPLLSLLTTAHPSIATTIEGATAVYTTGKNYSPRFRSGAEYVESYVAPVANTVGSMGKAAGVEGGLRWYLKKASRGRRQKAKDLESGESHKRRKVGKDSSALAQAHNIGFQAPQLPCLEADRRLSIGTVETLPEYDDVRSPDYTEIETVVPGSVPGQQPFKTRLFMTTSGLSVSMSDESLKSLKFCLGWLKWANEHISQVIKNLKTALEQYDSKMASVDAMEVGQVERERSVIVDRIATLKNDVLKTLQDAIQTVSKYAGGALPENARILVRNQLTSLPQRFFLAQNKQGSDASGIATPTTKGQEQLQSQQAEHSRAESAVRDGAQKVLVLAREGLDMMAQVSNVLDGTIVSAEEWCEKLGRKRRASQDLPSGSRGTPAPDSKNPFPEAPVSALPGNEDVSMTG
ncbi:hypothetical protein MKZ38_007927 [Zalerion maritima]|uniref:Opi1-domain-containing protein n=1 Tax=Zalerion maritima TaxID=339359 RepID=A0AAD5WNX7_9PEZI|nr:hypothetical protein MKZ38_007927 [Zalerion maritima]